MKLTENLKDKLTIAITAGMLVVPPLALAEKEPAPTEMTTSEIRKRIAELKIEIQKCPNWCRQGTVMCVVGKSDMMESLETELESRSNNSWSNSM